MTKHYLIQDDDGVLTLRQAENTSANYFLVGGKVPPEEMPPALAIGLKAVSLVPDGLAAHVNDVTWSSYSKRVLVDSHCVEPKPLVGIDWLKSLPVGTIRAVTVVDVEVEPFVVVSTGICWLNKDEETGDPQYRTWAEVEEDAYCWLKNACPRTCPEWNLEEK